MTFWQKYYRNQLVAVEIILNDKRCEYDDALKSFTIGWRKCILEALMETQIREFNTCQH